ncbi:MAG: TetR family transcriptional regulator [Gammaproteobacteria bacterium]|nr:TetR family transcriptional regulator [Gammaproteobacteria bacterium]
MNNRQERKLLTRQSLMNAALQWVEEGQHISSLSIREVAKRAGVVPTAFYRHFSDVDDLTLNLVDELSKVLRQLMREVRHNRADPHALIRDSIARYCDYAFRQRVYFVFLTQSMTGGTPLIRQAIRSELQYFANELATDVRHLGLLPNMDQAMLENVAQLTINTVANATMELLDLPDGNEAARQQFEKRLKRHLQVIFIGAANWKTTVAG